MRDPQVLLLGTGVVGSAFLDLVLRRDEIVSLAAVANTRGHVTRDGVGRPGIAPLLHRLSPGAVLVDATAADGMQTVYDDALAQGIHVVSANKKPFVVPWSQRPRATRGARLAYSATVGAGLPILATIQRLVASADEIVRVEGLLSGTLGYVTEEIHRGIPLVDAIASAKALGYTEPDPREDLRGSDVARKAVILARELGAELELGDVELTPFVREGEDVDRDVRRLAARGERRVYLARIEARRGEVRASVGPVVVGADHPAARVRGPLAMVAITSRRHATPLVIEGPGAGGRATAAALLRDVLAVSKERSNPSLRACA
jgi:aspartokinase/homoserine dehydrogenase 1